MKKALLLLVVLACFAANTSCAEIERFAETSRQSTQTSAPPIKSEFVVMKGVVGKPRILILNTVETWKGKDSREIKYKATQAPWVVNGGYKPTSQIASSFTLNVWKEYGGGIQSQPMPYVTRTGLTSFLLEEKGQFTIEVQASGCTWWVKIGVE